jgi:hypothetical protein
MRQEHISWGVVRSKGTDAAKAPSRATGTGARSRPVPACFGTQDSPCASVWEAVVRINPLQSDLGRCSSRPRPTAAAAGLATVPRDAANTQQCAPGQQWQVGAGERHRQRRRGNPGPQSGTTRVLLTCTPGTRRQMWTLWTKHGSRSLASLAMYKDGSEAGLRVGHGAGFGRLHDTSGCCFGSVRQRASASRTISGGLCFGTLRRSWGTTTARRQRPQ